MSDEVNVEVKLLIMLSPTPPGYPIMPVVYYPARAYVNFHVPPGFIPYPQHHQQVDQNLRPAPGFGPPLETDSNRFPNFGHELAPDPTKPPLSSGQNFDGNRNLVKGSSVKSRWVYVYAWSSLIEANEKIPFCAGCYI